MTTERAILKCLERLCGERHWFSMREATLLSDVNVFLGLRPAKGLGAKAFTATLRAMEERGHVACVPDVVDGTPQWKITQNGRDALNAR